MDKWIMMEKLQPLTFIVFSGQCARLQLASCLVQALRTTSDDDDFLLVLTAESLALPTTSYDKH